MCLRTCPLRRVESKSGDLITAAQWNLYLGVASSIDYLKTETDKLDDMSASDVTGSRAVNGTVYQNTSGKIRMVLVQVRTRVNDDGAGSISGTSFIQVHCDAATPPTTLITQGGLDIEIDDGGQSAAAFVQSYASLVFAVPLNYYYKATGSNVTNGIVPVLGTWFEWDLH